MPADSSSTVEVNGPAVREWRMERGLEQLEVAEAIDVTRSYLTKIELGHSRRVSPKVFAGLVAVLGVKDRRTLLANPYAPLAAGELAATA